MQLGIDTGGTFTDAALLDDACRVIASAKAATTRHDLSIGIGAAIDAVLAAAKVDAREIRLVGLSTTLATNAIVEGQGGRAGLVLIGFEQAQIERAGLKSALGDDPVIFLPGGHGVFGEEAAPLDLDGLGRFVDDTKMRLDAYAVASLFSVRNPDHERRAAALIAERGGRPVSVSHQLASELDAPRRALTALFNARLIPIVTDLVERARGLLVRAGIEAPLMVVRGNGALISAREALARPVETVLSGPAASVVGAAFLTGLSEAVVADIGGTTTDIGILRDGFPISDPRGAEIGGRRMMIDAVRMATFGLGGDSEVWFDDEAPGEPIRLGPRRVIPLAAFAGAHPDLVHRVLDEQLLKPLPGSADGRFALLIRNSAGAAMEWGESAMLAALSDGPQPLERLLAAPLQHAALRRLVSRGLVAIAALTPTDAAHILGRHADFDVAAARKAGQLFLRRRTRLGTMRAASATALAEAILAALVDRSADFILEAAASFDGLPAAGLAQHPLVAAALAGKQGFVTARIGLSVPVVGLGASAPLHYPAIARRLSARAEIPAHAGVANAIGAVVGLVRRTISLRITQPERGRFRLHAAAGPTDFIDHESALAHARGEAEHEARARLAAEGAENCEIRLEIAERSADIGGEIVIVETIVSAQATGRPAPRKAEGAT